MYFEGGLAPTSQTVGFLFRIPQNSLAGQKNEILTNIFLLNTPCKFADSPVLLFGNYCKIVLHANHIFLSVYPLS